MRKALYTIVTLNNTILCNDGKFRTYEMLGPNATNQPRLYETHKGSMRTYNKLSKTLDENDTLRATVIFENDCITKEFNIIRNVPNGGQMLTTVNDLVELKAALKKIIFIIKGHNAHMTYSWVESAWYTIEDAENAMADAYLAVQHTDQISFSIEETTLQ